MPGSLTVEPGGQIQGSLQVSRTSDVSVVSKGQESLRSLTAGDSLNGKVVSVMKGADGTRTAQIDLGGNTIVDAKLQNGMSLSAGQTLSFTVKSSASGTLTLTPLYQNTAALDATASKALLAAGLPVSDELGQMVSEMMKEGMSIDKQSLLQMSRVLSDNPGADISMLVQMKNLNIPITEGNIQQFQNYQNYQHQVLYGVNSIVDELPQAFDQMAASADKTQALNLYGDLMKLFLGQDLEAASSDLEGKAVAASDQELPSDLKNVAVPNTTGEVETSKEQDLQAMKMQNSIEGLKTADNQEVQIKDANVAVTKEAQSELVAGANSQAAASAGNALSLESKMDIMQLAKGLKNANVSPEELNSLIKAGNGDQVGLLRQLSDLYDKTIHTSESVDKAWGKLFSSDTFTQVLKNNIASSWTIGPDDVSDKENVKSLYERLNSQVKQVTQLLQGHVGENSNIFQNSQNLSQNIDFMNQLNQMFAYVQLPLKMSGNDAHGDLYVYSNKKHMAADDGSVSALLHLDMNNLGSLDIYVRMTDRKVNTHFYMADESCIDLVMSHIDELTLRLNKRGYQMNYQVLPADDISSENQVIDELLQKNDKMTLLSSSSFDARA